MGYHRASSLWLRFYSISRLCSH